MLIVPLTTAPLEGEDFTGLLKLQNVEWNILLSKFGTLISSAYSHHRWSQCVFLFLPNCFEYYESLKDVFPSPENAEVLEQQLVRTIMSIFLQILLPHSSWCELFRRNYNPDFLFAQMNNPENHREVVKILSICGQADRKVSPLNTHLTVSFSWYLFGVCLPLDHDCMCSEMDFTQEKSHFTQLLEYPIPPWLYWIWSFNSNIGWFYWKFLFFLLLLFCHKLVGKAWKAAFLRPLTMFWEPKNQMSMQKMGQNSHFCLQSVDQ